MNKDLDILVKAENVEEFLAIYRLTRYCELNDMEIPSIHIIRLFKIMYDKELLKRNNFLEEAERCSTIAIEKFRSLKMFEPTWKVRTVPNSADLLKPDMSKVVTELIYAFHLFKEDETTAGKDEAISFFYWAIQDFYKSDIEEEDLIKYKITYYATIAGILTMAIGFQLTSKSNDKLNKDAIYQSTRNAIKIPFESQS